MSEEKETVLVLCVDRDNDVGTKAGVKTPVIGRSENLEAAARLALKDPEEADANAIFGAVRTYDALTAETWSSEYEVATIVGSELGGIKADMQMRRQLDEVMEKFPAESIILVTDGYADEDLIPIIQSRVPIMSIRRIIVKHSEAIEESAAVISRYLRSLVEDPYYARWVLGIPGILLLTMGVLWILSVVYAFPLSLYTSIAFVIILGLLFLIKGFRIEEQARLLIYPTPPNLVRGFATLAMVIILGVDAHLTYLGLYQELGDPLRWVLGNPPINEVVGYAIAYSIDLIVIGVGTLLVGWGVYFFLRRDTRVWQNVVGIVVSVWTREVALRSSEILLQPPPITPDEVISAFVLSVSLGIITTVITIMATNRLSKRFAQYFKRPEAGER
ncbi:MAG: DUF373 family protein [Candidatus Bathyarchaeia archaeon]